MAIAVRYTKQARNDLQDALEYIAKERPSAARDIAQVIETAIADLADYPHRGRPGRIATTRELVIPRLPFVIAYSVSTTYIDVLAIPHGARRWPSSL